jgi:GxxExxY protein
MPITPKHPVRRLSQEEFGELAYAVMGCVFDIHRDFGCIFDEKIYKRELASRFAGVEIEFPISITHGTFSRTYYVDAFVANGGPFEFKAVEMLAPRHRRQLYNYLLMLDLAHGKLANLRTESVQHEFVNATLRPDERRQFIIVSDRWNRSSPASNFLLESLVSVLKDWGTGLEISLYESALTHFLGGDDAVIRNVPVHGSRGSLGSQPMRLAAENVAFKVTALESELDAFEAHVRRLLAHTRLHAILWMNIALHEVTFVTVRQES